jgi:hypothetical protein
LALGITVLAFESSFLIPWLVIAFEGLSSFDFGLTERESAASLIKSIDARASMTILN